VCAGGSKARAQKGVGVWGPGEGGRFRGKKEEAKRGGAKGFEGGERPRSQNLEPGGICGVPVKKKKKGAGRDYRSEKVGVVEVGDHQNHYR